MVLVAPVLPRDNRAFAAYAKSLGVEYNLGATTDNFNEAHNKFLLDYMICKNHKSLPFYFDYVSYKRGTDILTESQQFKLCRIICLTKDILCISMITKLS